jgi:hypothetical protein
MARGGPQSLGNTPPQLVWTIVRGDTAAFKVYATDDSRIPLNIPDYTISMEIKRPNSSANLGVITDDATLVLALTPYQDPDDSAGEFTVSLSAVESAQLESGDIFDIELRSAGDAVVWTVGQGSISVVEDVTN